jgi:hypothetical protein
MNLLAASAAMALERAAYPIAAAILDKEKDLLAAEPDYAGTQVVRAAVEAWQKAQGLVAEATKAIQERNPEAAQQALAQLQAVQLARSPLVETAKALGAAREAIVQAKAQEGELKKQQEKDLADLKQRLGEARARAAAVGPYVQAAGLHAQGKWQEAIAALEKLAAEPAGLAAFEVQDVGALLADARKQVKEAALAQLRRDAEIKIGQADQKLASGELDGAAAILQEVAQSDVCKEDANVRAAVDQAKGRIEAARQELARQHENAKRALSDAAASIYAGDLAEAERLLTQADGMPACQGDAGLKAKAAELRQQLATAQQKREERKKQVLDKLAQVEAKLAEGKQDAAREVLSQVSEDPVCQFDPEARAKAVVLGRKVGTPLVDLDAEKGVEDIQARVAARDFAGAADRMDKVVKLLAAGDPLNEKLADLKEQIDDAEQDAGDLCKKAQKAYAAKDTDKLRKLLDELRTNYGNTRTYRQNYVKNR